MPRKRPDVFRWLWYSLGGRLPERYHAWILHDATTGSWRWRHVARSTVMIAPLCAVWLLLPGPLTLRLAIVLMAALVAYFYSMAYMEESIEHRLAKNGFPPGIGRRTRAEAVAVAEAEVTERYLARYRNQAGS
ncbi:DUF5313 domain-containing protein [Amycolatopsis roodepoortensis]|uniref:DUF5313 domain-containing protein n=1 Tax=Amycolatopsis roodepoortensis TaxID=700274 RepID=UPI000F88C200|nr:DUF5313 domain-containing protein [Amycolatopsis roodepoortensis]RSN11305.1 hypothetical protein DMC63_29820 [Streptomyces sp. WAC 05977]UUV33263.1 DUF5313 domain-containing protein [Amycolatopsis roodepoortensis]